MSENGHCPTPCFFNVFQRCTDVFRLVVLFQTPRMALFHPNDHALRKVLTNETPSGSLLFLSLREAGKLTPHLYGTY